MAYGNTSPESSEESPHIANVSQYDPKDHDFGEEKSYTKDNVAPLAENGAYGIIIKSSDGLNRDPNFTSFLKSADRVTIPVGNSKMDMLIGAYHFIRPRPSGKRQAKHYLNWIRQAGKDNGIRSDRILLVGDIAHETRPKTVYDFAKSIHDLAGVYPVLYPENGDNDPDWIENTLPKAAPFIKKRIAKCPLWIALYSPYGAANLTPDKKTQSYDTWANWKLWQYGGVNWQNHHAVIANYEHSDWKSSKYFGKLNQPLERNVFRGDLNELQMFWKDYSFAWKR